MKASRIYLIGYGQTMRLVRANHRSQALAHVAKTVINVKVASQDELVEALGRGIQVEQSVEPDTEQMFEQQAA